MPAIFLPEVHFSRWINKRDIIKGGRGQPPLQLRLRAGTAEPVSSFWGRFSLLPPLELPRNSLRHALSVHRASLHISFVTVKSLLV